MVRLICLYLSMNCVYIQGGPDGPAREIRLENNRMKPIFSVTHDKIKFEK